MVFFSLPNVCVFVCVIEFIHKVNDDEERKSDDLYIVAGKHLRRKKERETDRESRLRRHRFSICWRFSRFSCFRAT